METYLLIFIVLVEMVGAAIGVGVGYWMGRRDKILGAL